MEALCLFFYYPAYAADKRSVSLLSLFHSVAALLSLPSYLLFVLFLCSQLFFSTFSTTTAVSFTFSFWLSCHFFFFPLFYYATTLRPLVTISYTYHNCEHLQDFSCGCIPTSRLLLLVDFIFLCCYPCPHLDDRYT